jgi:hypothetical protein
VLEEEIKLSELVLADNAALVTNNTKEAQILLAAIEKYAAEVGLFINPSKTEIIITTGLNEERWRQQEMELLSKMLNILSA